MAVRSISTDFGGPSEKAVMLSTPWGYLFFSRMRTLSSIESSSNGFMECFTPAVSTAVWALFTLGLTWKFYVRLACAIGHGKIEGNAFERVRDVNPKL